MESRSIVMVAWRWEEGKAREGELQRGKRELAPLQLWGIMDTFITHYDGVMGYILCQNLTNCTLPICQLVVCWLEFSKAGTRRRGRGRRESSSSSRQDESFWGSQATLTDLRGAWTCHVASRDALRISQPRILSARDTRLLFICSFYFSRALPVCLACAGRWRFRGKSHTVPALVSSFYSPGVAFLKSNLNLAPCPKHPSQAPFIEFEVFSDLIFVPSLANSWEKAFN